MAKKKLSARLARLLSNPITDRELGNIYAAAVASRDRAAMRKAVTEMAARSDWGVFDSRFEVPQETHARAGDLDGGATVEPVEEDAGTSRAWKLFERKLARVRELYEAVSEGEKPNWQRIERATDEAYKAAPNRKAQHEVTDFDFTAAEQLGAALRSSKPERSSDEQTRRELARIFGGK